MKKVEIISKKELNGNVSDNLLKSMALVIAIISTIIYIGTYISTKQNPPFFFAELNLIFSIVGAILCVVCGVMSIFIFNKPKTVSALYVFTSLFLLITNVHQLLTGFAMLVIAVMIIATSRKKSVLIYTFLFMLFSPVYIMYY